MTDSTFETMLRRVRDGDAQAAEQLVRLYEPQVRRVIRVRLTDVQLRRQMDSIDVCQSVLGDFFMRITLGQFDLSSPGELIGLLSKMARNKLINRARHHHAARRDVTRQIAITDDSPSLPGSEQTPSMIVSRQELLQTCRRLLSDEERRLAEGRAQGRSWDELAADFGVSPGALQMRYARALDRVAEDLGWESGDAL
jgi:RNA polymerase sigma factor (sigma-70 family)